MSASMSLISLPSGSCRGPIPNASQAGDTLSVRASRSTVSTAGSCRPFSISPIVECDTPAILPSLISPSPASWRTSKSRAPSPEQAIGVATPNGVARHFTNHNLDLTLSCFPYRSTFTLSARIRAPPRGLRGTGCVRGSNAGRSKASRVISSSPSPCAPLSH